VARRSGARPPPGPWPAEGARRSVFPAFPRPACDPRLRVQSAVAQPRLSHAGAFELPNQPAGQRLPGRPEGGAMCRFRVDTLQVGRAHFLHQASSGDQAGNRAAGRFRTRAGLQLSGIFVSSAQARFVVRATLTLLITDVVALCGREQLQQRSAVVIGSQLPGGDLRLPTVQVQHRRPLPGRGAQVLTLQRVVSAFGAPVVVC